MKYGKWLAILFISLACWTPEIQATTLNRSLSKYLLEPMPNWYREGFTRGHLNIPLLIKDGFSRLEAVEIQNQMKDLLESDSEYMTAEKNDETVKLFKNQDTHILSALQKAIQKVREEKYFESGFQPQSLKAHEFYAVFDMDETLLVHWYQSGEKGPAYYDLKVPTLDRILRPLLYSPDYISMTPGWEKALLEISRTPGCKGIIIFTAKEDQSSLDLISRLKIEGKPLRGFLKGIFTRNHLVRDNKSVKLSKDLRIIDESLEHVVLIDDNPTRIFPEQQKNLREFPKYNADIYLKSKNSGQDSVVRTFFEKLLPQVTEEIKESVQYSQTHKISFASAFYPYSMEASTEMLTLLGQGYSWSQARELLRTRPEIFEPQFYVPTGGTPH